MKIKELIHELQLLENQDLAVARVGRATMNNPDCLFFLTRVQREIYRVYSYETGVTEPIEFISLKFERPL